LSKAKSESDKPTEAEALQSSHQIRFQATLNVMPLQQNAPVQQKMMMAGGHTSGNSPSPSSASHTSLVCPIYYKQN